MKLEHCNPELSISEDAWAWRYINYNKLWDFLYWNQIYFSRIDAFDDPLEGLRSDLRFKLHLKNISKLESQDDPLRKIISTNQFVITESEISRYQKGVFSSCWYLTENFSNRKTHHESLAMWQLYGNENCFAVKIFFKNLHDIMTKTLNDFKDTEINRAQFGKVEYLSLFEYSQKETNTPILTSIIKDPSYAHENEIRFSLLRDEGDLERKGVKLKLKPNLLNDIKSEITVLAHPNMDINSYELYKEKLNSIGYRLEYSQLLTKKVVSDLLR